MSPDEQFFQMRERIAHNAGSKFGGAVCIVPPKGGEVISYVILDESEDEAAFWSSIMGKIQRVINKLDEKERIAGAFRR